ncbi:OsmC family protein [Oceanobacillus alkalisoli]|uniref:OsmC family protein n=1 Tax=Oceanobacillus alkalisoli TaxID=2925113 RepID=UPI001EEFE281|nr:OsmC family protein [Oceanobacillus alkalisoli]MCF3941974.1 OsmC family protein [Oceanobacillus alkalisoli]MCG5102073.1 OsmC family protein [Oceanobacillus alkalisoli]
MKFNDLMDFQLKRGGLLVELKMKWEGKRAFTGVTPSGHQLITDGLPEFGGEGRGPAPMEMLLGTVIGCTGIDIIAILEKMRLVPTDFHVEAKGDRAQSHPRRYRDIYLHYTVIGEIPEDKLYRAIELSLNKYCAVSYSLNAELKASYSLNGGDQVIMDLD